MLTALYISWGANEQTSSSCAGRWLIISAVRWFNRGRELLTMPTGQVWHDWVWKDTETGSIAIQGLNLKKIENIIMWQSHVTGEETQPFCSRQYPIIHCAKDNRPFSQQTFWLVTVGKAQVLLITLMVAPFYSSVPVSHDSVTVSRHAQYQDPEKSQISGSQLSLGLTQVFQYQEAGSFLTSKSVNSLTTDQSGHWK